jgi:pimeloyl-ACP methyl ester carboxylesterase
LSWEPEELVSRESILESSARAHDWLEAGFTSTPYRFRIDVAGLPWDVGGAVYEPRSGELATGPDGRKVGVFLIHGGGGDHRSFDTMAKLLAAGKSYKVVTITYPGNLYLRNQTHDWPGDTMEPDGRVRTPMWAEEEDITPDQFDLVTDASDDVFRAKYGTLFFIRAHEGTRLYDRLASWPWAYEEAFKEACRRHLPEGEFSVYISGASTGGPFAHMSLQRIPNVVGLLGAETSNFGFLCSKMLGQGWPYPFYQMTVRTWRDVARYAGPEAGPEGCWRLPWLIEEVFERHQAMLHLPLLKAQHLVQFCAVDQFRAAGEVTGRRLGLGAAEVTALGERFAGYPFPLPGDSPRVPPLLYSIMSNSRDHTYQRYSEILLPEVAKFDPAPKARIVRFAVGIHSYQKPLEGLPFGTAPAVADLWSTAIDNGYYLSHS